MLHRREVDAVEQPEPGPQPCTRRGHARQLPRPAVRRKVMPRHRSLPYFSVMMPARGLADGLPPPALGLAEEPVAGARDVRRLLLELAVAREAVVAQPPVGEGGIDRAAGLPLVAAVGEPAAGGDVRDVGERRVQALARPGDAERADPRGVDEERAAGQADQLPVRGRVAAAGVVLPDRAGSAGARARGGRSRAWTCPRPMSPARRPSVRAPGGAREIAHAVPGPARRSRRPPYPGRRCRPPSAGPRGPRRRRPC